jgi:hypothetical protein
VGEIDIKVCAEVATLGSREDTACGAMGPHGGFGKSGGRRGRSRKRCEGGRFERRRAIGVDRYLCRPRLGVRFLMLALLKRRRRNRIGSDDRVIRVCRRRIGIVQEEGLKATKLVGQLGVRCNDSRRGVVRHRRFMNRILTTTAGDKLRSTHQGMEIRTTLPIGVERSASWVRHDAGMNLCKRRSTSFTATVPTVACYSDNCFHPSISGVPVLAP